MTAFDSRSTPWSGKRSPELENFRLTFAALAGIAVAALVIAAAVLIHHDRSSAPLGKPAKWSSFKPSAGGDAGALEIADYVSAYYRVSATQQFTVVTPVNTASLNASTGTYTGAGLALAASDTSNVNDLKSLPGSSVAYDLCGAGGPNCSVGVKSNADLELLARREALELALYTFEYLKGTSYVAVVLPTGLSTGTGPKSGSQAVLFDRKALASMLEEPLDQTLSSQAFVTSEAEAWTKTSEAELVDLTTGSSLYTAHVEAQDGLTLLEMLPLPAR